MNSDGPVIAILPSREEAATIAQVASAVDRVMQGGAGSIVNVDCSKSDLTQRTFCSVSTATSKKSVHTGTAGKGYQVLLGLAEERTAGRYLLVDTDNSRPEATVFAALLSAVDEGADLAIADYNRLWIEGNLTNHVARPILYASVGLDLPQPISGDIAISGRLAKAVLEAFELIKIDGLAACVGGYGIDAFIVLVAAKAGFDIVQVPVRRRKYHATSFPHLPKSSVKPCLSC